MFLMLDLVPVGVGAVAKALVCVEPECTYCVLKYLINI